MKERLSTPEAKQQLAMQARQITLLQIYEAILTNR